MALYCYFILGFILYYTFSTFSTMMKNTTILSQGQLQLRKKLRPGTWNIRSMLQLGKVQLLGDEMMRLGVDICVLSELRWNGQGHFTTLDGHKIVYSGRLTQGISGVAVWIHRKIAGAMVGPISSCSHNHQYCQPFPHLRPVSPHSQGIRYLTTA